VKPIFFEIQTTAGDRIAVNLQYVVTLRKLSATTAKLLLSTGEEFEIQAEYRNAWRTMAEAVSQYAHDNMRS
jgi:hypothetical protein